VGGPQKGELAAERGRCKRIKHAYQDSGQKGFGGTGVIWSKSRKRISFRSSTVRRGGIENSPIEIVVKAKVFRSANGAQRGSAATSKKPGGTISGGTWGGRGECMNKPQSPHLKLSNQKEKNLLRKLHRAHRWAHARTAEARSGGGGWHLRKGKIKKSPEIKRGAGMRTKQSKAQSKCKKRAGKK